MTDFTPEPVEMLHRWERGQYKGTHCIIDYVLYNEAGEEVARQPGLALTPEQAVERGFPFEDVLAQLQTDALVKVSELEAQVADKDRIIAELKTAPPATAPELAAKDAIIQDLMAQLEAAQAQ